MPSDDNPILVNKLLLLLFLLPLGPKYLLQTNFNTTSFICHNLDKTKN